MHDGIADRPVPLRRRPDLVVCAVESASGRRWRVKDPVAGSYFELNDHEQAILSMLDGRASLSEIATRFALQFPPMRLGASLLQEFLARLREAGLVVGDLAVDESSTTGASGTGLAALPQRVLGLTAIRLPGVNPQRFLDACYPHVRFLFRPTVLMALGLFVVGVFGLLAAEFDSIRLRLPALASFLTPDRLIWLWGAVAAARVVHELAHAFCCRHFGGRCPELGVMLLCGAPCLYCDVSDAWMLPRRGARIAISAAGIIAELVIAACAALVWWRSEPGVAHSVALALTATCSVNTLLLNGNPLLRYDGYYILMDLLEEPHLAEDALGFWRDAWREWGLGMDVGPPSRSSRPRLFLLAIYGTAAAIYRCLVLIAILWFAREAIAAAGFPDAGQLVMTTGGAAWLAIPAVSGVRVVRDAGWRRRLNSNVAIRNLLILGALLAAVCFVPLPRRIAADLIVESPGAPRVYVAVPGRLDQTVPADSNVEQGDLIARLSNAELEREVLRLAAEHRQAELKLRRLEIARGHDPTAAAQIPAAREAEQSLARRTEKKLRDVEQLSIRATVEGRLLPPVPRTPPPRPTLELAEWSGEPLSDHNLGCWLEAGTLLGQIAKEYSLSPTLLVGQHDVDLVRIGQTVRMRFDARPSEVFLGEVVEIAAEPVADHPFAVSGSSNGQWEQGQGGSSPRAKNSGVRFACRVRLAGREHALTLRDSGVARISIEPATAVEQTGRWLRQTFRFR